MSANWTDKQREAIDHSDGAAIVSAAAGSGKTAVLVERVIRLITDEKKNIDADKLVVATFTEKAAGELQTRLQKALNEALAKNPSDSYIRSQRVKLEDASISTISSFCMKLIRENSSFLGLSPDFSVVDEAEGQLLYDRALNMVMEQFYEEGDEAEKTLLYDWYGREDDSELCTAVTALHSFMRKLPDPDGSMKKWQEMYDNPAEYKEKLFALYADICIKPFAEEMSELLPQNPLMWDEVSEPCYNSWKYIIGNLLKISGISDPFYSGSDASLADILSAEPEAPKKAPADYDDGALKETHKLLSAVWKKAVPYLTAMERYEENMAECAPVLKALTALAVKVDEEYSAAKRGKNKIDFSDAEFFALKLLSDERIAFELRKNAAVIIVDEFQDSNDMQYEIFRRLSDNGRNLFFVGDIKQSIYRFRGANPGVFAKIMEDDSFKAIHLNRNFRSCETVIDSVNGIFEKTMTKALGEVDYNDDAKLVTGAVQYNPNESNRTELIRVHGKRKPEAREKEGAYIADRIRNMVESGFMVTDKDGTTRPCGYGDFAVLMGKYRSNIHLYKKAFAKAGVPIDASEDGAYTDYYEVKLILSLLRVIDNPYYNLELMALLTLPPYNMTPDEIAEAKLCTDGKVLYPGVRKYAERNEKAKRFCEELSALREFAAEHSVEQLIRYIYDESDVVTAILATVDGDKRDSNLKLLIGYARRFSENGIRGLYDFLQYMESVSRGDIKVAQAKSAENVSESVKVMTIHGSKGLEFPIVFVANLSADHRSRSSGKINTDIDLGIGMRVVRHSQHIILDSFMFNLIERMGTMQELSEEMRLLYVAATRAKEKLIFTSPLSDRDNCHKVHLKWVEESRAVAKGMIDVRDIYAYKPEKHEKSDDEKEKTAAIAPFGSYAHKEATLIPSKVTATQVGVKSVDDFAETVSGVDRFLKTPTFIKGEIKRKLSGKKKGDAYHKAMELLDFSGNTTQLDELYRRGKLTDREYECIDSEEVETFLESELCGRIVRSGSVHKEFPIFCEYSPENLSEDEEKPFVQGIADLYFEEDGELVLVDYKTNANTDPDTLRAEYEGQLKIYAEALEKMTCMRVKECFLWSFTAKTAVKVEI